MYHILFYKTLKLQHNFYINVLKLLHILKYLICMVFFSDLLLREYSNLITNDVLCT